MMSHAKFYAAVQALAGDDGHFTTTIDITHFSDGQCRVEYRAYAKGRLNHGPTGESVIEALSAPDQSPASVDPPPSVPL